MTRDVEIRILAHTDIPAREVAARVGCSVEQVEDTRREHNRSPRTGRHVLEVPVEELRGCDWSLAMRSNSSPFL